MKRLILGFVFLLSVCLSVPAETFSGLCVAISDGDTISVMRDGAPVKVRLHGIDCPESNQDFGTKAKEYTGRQAHEKVVTVDVTDTDRYGRLVGIVTLPNGRVLNHDLVKIGLAWWYRNYARGDKDLEKYETRARLSETGLWSMPDPVAPWDFRRGVEAKAGTATPVEPATGETMVYVTNHGKKYHRASCKYLAKSSNAVALASIGDQYGPCAICQPPELEREKPLTPVAESPKMRGPPVQALPQQQPQAQRFQQQEETAAVTVYVTKTGAKYHSGGCRYLSKSKIPMDLDRAKGQYGPCSVCSPPR